MPALSIRTQFASLAAAAVAAAAVALLSACGDAATAATATDAVPQEAAIRKALGERLVGAPKIDEVRTTPIAGLYEVRMGNDIFYTDVGGAYIVRGEILDIKARRNLTEERINKLTAIDFATLPLQDAIVWKSGSGARKL